MLYTFDLRKLLRRYSPVWFRWPENQSLAYALCRRLGTLDVWFGRLRNDVVKESAPGFFATHQMAMVESILMRVSRLMDPEKSVGQDNASFKRLVQFSPFNTHAKDWTAIHEEWNDGGKFGRVRHLRNKFLAHNDLTLWKCRPPGQSWIPISPDDFQCVIDLAKALWSLLRKVYRA